MRITRPSWTYLGFNRAVYGSITNSINRELRRVRHSGQRPSLIRMGVTASCVWAEENWHEYGDIEHAPKEYHGIPIKLLDRSIEGVIVDAL
jgi:hypothetical protein